MAMAADAATTVHESQAVPTEIKSFELALELTAADQATLEAAHGLVTFNTPFLLPGIAGGPFLLTLSKDKPNRP